LMKPQWNLGYIAAVCTITTKGTARLGSINDTTILVILHRIFFPAVRNGLFSIDAFVQTPISHHLDSSPSAQAPSVSSSDNLIM
jgi:hypothetical protein